ncbi:MAG: InlB B-repeat-containing protein [Oscillospiraceae bacterium]|nr:InlB B-repeat-containing protein [Oscillospiraceae bacterium]
MKKKIFSFMLTVVTLFLLMTALPLTANAADIVDINDSSVFLTQKANDTCTLASVLMMFRRGALINKNTGWKSFTESNYKSKWWSGGLLNTITGEGMVAKRVNTPYAKSPEGKKDVKASSKVYKQQKQLFIDLLSEHPEGVMVWLSWQSTHRHAVLLTDYNENTDTFYCADPAGGYSGKRIKLSSSSLATLTYAGSYTKKSSNTQEDVLAHVWAYWSITSGIEYCSHTTADGNPNYKTIQQSGGSYIAVCKSCSKEFEPVFVKDECGVYVVTNSEGDLSTAPYKESALACTTQGQHLNIVGYVINAYGNKWYKTDGDTWIYSSYISKSGDLQYTVAFNPKGGSVSPTEQVYAYEGTYGSLPVPTREGYTFAGWYTKSSGGTRITKNSSVKYPDHTLYAYWPSKTSASKRDTVGKGYTTSGSDVSDMQAMLNAVNNAKLTVGGELNTSTTNAVVAYQQKKGLSADGICGPSTWADLMADFKASGSLTITVQPQDYFGQVGSTATFTVEATGSNLTYFWEFKDVGGVWKTSKSTTATATCGITEERNGRKYRCTVTDERGNSTVSEAATLQICDALTIVSQPQDYTGLVDDTAIFTVEASGENLTYFWEFKDVGGAWKTSKATTATATCGIKEERNGRQYRCTITDRQGNSVVSELATLYVKAATLPDSIFSVTTMTTARGITVTWPTSANAVSYRVCRSVDGGDWETVESVCTSTTYEDFDVIAGSIYEYGVLAENECGNSEWTYGERVAAFAVNGVVLVNGKWIYIVNGSQDASFTGLVENETGWWYIRSGEVDFTYTGLVQNEYGWWYVFDGVLDLSFTGLVTNDYGTWFIYNGQLADRYIGLLQDEYGWKYIYNGRFADTYTGLVQNEYGWWYVRNGMLDFSYTGLVENEYGWWYVSGGSLDLSFTGLVTNDYGTWFIYNGQLAVGYTGLVQNGDKWIYVSGGRQDDTYTGLVQNEYGWWYVSGGVLDLSFTGIVTNDYGTWYIYNGQLAVRYTGLVQNGNKWIFISSGRQDDTYTGLVQNDYGWWYVFGGVLDLRFTGTVTNEYGTWNIYNGQVV